ncbi:MAG: epoxide hydrolase [Acidobacteria bacterium]|nr:MAG: epoxide hydrolase [Acidobacteriota bacterium]REK05905.1 MAG: epoxide hydrolase [Acidobacteriota bacterium]
MADHEPFRVEVPVHEIEDLQRRLRATRWPEKETVDDWSQGTPLAYLQEVCRTWAEDYDWRDLETRLNTHPQFLAELDGLPIHFLHVRSPHQEARPLILTHGWPGSVVEFLQVIPKLTCPTEHDGTCEDAFHLVVPSLPGFGFSGKPADTGWTVERTARAWSRLMAELGYERYFAQGGDWGSVVTASIGVQDPEHCAGVHVNMPVVGPDPATMDDLSELEKRALAAMKHYQDWDSGYSKQQSTRPQSVGYGLVDSPAGLAGWIVEKFWAWTDCDGHPENALSRTQILDNLSIYWFTRSGASSARLYWESFGKMSRDPVKVPSGCTIFPKEIFQASRRWTEKRFENLVYWNEVDRGGHFAAFEQPDLFAKELRAAFRAMRG